MEYLQYFKGSKERVVIGNVLNLVISGIPSILIKVVSVENTSFSFKPCYKWNTFNTLRKCAEAEKENLVLNLVISGIPSILKNEF